MQHLLTPEGDLALVALLRQHPLMAFDFDGTLAPIVARPDDARISQAVASRMRALAQRLPVAIVTGRSIADVRERLGFEPRFIVGNHGAEDDAGPDDAAALVGALDDLRRSLNRRTDDLKKTGVTVEDKGLSIALHYRLARDRVQASAMIAELLADVASSLHVFAGKMVVNVTAAQAPDKACAVRSLVDRCGAASAFFAGDDVNDEVVFVSAPAHWLTLRVGREDPACQARFCIDGQQEMAMMLERILSLHAPAQAG
ncbi:MAG: trehalose-phosphatase [Burkholderiaceae bacterium]